MIGLILCDPSLEDCLSAYFFFNCMIYQLLRVQHSCSSTQSWGSVLPSIVEMRDQNSGGFPLLFSNRNLGSFMCIGDRNPIHPQPLGSCGPLRNEMHYTCLIIIHDPGIKPGTFGLADECSTTELSLQRAQGDIGLFGGY